MDDIFTVSGVAAGCGVCVEAGVAVLGTSVAINVSGSVIVATGSFAL
jgi:bacterioferritin-associated ferredoxin